MSRHHSRTPSGHDSLSSPPESGVVTPSSPSASSSFISSSIYGAFGGLIRRFSSDPAGNMVPSTSNSHLAHGNDGVAGVFTPPINRTASPMQPPPLDPVVLLGFHQDTPATARLLSAPVAEEIRIMVPERLRIEEDWHLVYSLDQDGASLATLYEKCGVYKGKRGGFVLVVRDDEGGTFGAYLSEAPHISPHYFGTGECFLWRASLMAGLPPPPSADTADLAVRSTTIAASTPALVPDLEPAPLVDVSRSTPALAVSAADSGSDRHHAHQEQQQQQSPPPPPSPSIRFKAFPYSGVNEYYAYCEQHWLSVGAGDGKYGLWLDDGLERGVSSTCLTFGNEPLSDQGEKFGVLGVEVWVIGAKDR